MTEAEKKAREAAESVMSELHWGATVTQFMPQDIAASVHDDIAAEILAARRDAIEECAKEFREKAERAKALCGVWAVDSPNHHFQQGRMQAFTEGAAAIRALAEKPQGG